ncbi:hypothetical protein KIH31_08380 [Paenarthrobacter sp. DKR-5]|uniref:hypothetical protein n=1 Tax=Paenarthrobacter sp. DKR-5 TaxID=2835535 RepID=UPI001BDC01E4|nr:hypothetical protein [Paenarthrobacter sp. DKR-5]MBT1002618.1 hypothetical protein [Paenarthrobacter sp. DKR-5]
MATARYSHNFSADADGPLEPAAEDLALLNVWTASAYQEGAEIEYDRANRQLLDAVLAAAKGKTSLSRVATAANLTVQEVVTLLAGKNPGPRQLDLEAG